MENSEFTYDIFISYAREDYAWVRNSLYTPLTQCLLPEADGPRYSWINPTWASNWERIIWKRSPRPF